MQSDVWCLLTCIDDDVETGTSRTIGTGSKFLEYNPGSELNIFLMNNEQWKEQNNWMKTKSRTKDE